MNEQNRARFTREELAAHVKVPTVVEIDLKRMISDRLEQCGMYFRVFSRIKTATSMARKFEQKEYGEEHKLQDLVGVRINLYFDDDVDICRDIMERTFDVVGWSTSKRNEDEFKPTKLNGVFRLPGYLKDEISQDTWDMCIDDTFEIQIKTMFFEGWHEIEHDMRYKGEELWRDFQGFSRYLNSILATLELCDKSMITLFEDLGHALYKSGRWSDMIKSHFRIKLGDVPMYPEVEQLLNEDMAQVDNLAKRIYKTSKSFLVDQFLKRSRRTPINVNTIVAILNDSLFHDSRLTAIFRDRDVYNDGREESLAESRHYELRPLLRHTVFQMCTQVDGSRLKTEQPVTPDLIFTRAADYIYRWTMRKYGVLFADMPPETCTYHADTLAYHVTVNYDRENHRMNMHVRHMDLEVGGRIWYSEASLKLDHEEKVILKVRNGYAEPERENRGMQENSGTFFSYPGYYKTIVDNVGIFNGIDCLNRRRILREDQIQTLTQAIHDTKRTFPIVLIVSKENEDGMMDEEWLGQLRVSDFTRTVWRYAHVLTCYEKTGRQLLEVLGRDYSAEQAVPKIYVFWPDGQTDAYGPEAVKNCSFGRHLEMRDARTYDIVKGGQAFYHKIVTELRDWNVSASMWDGFDLEIMTEIPK